MKNINNEEDCKITISGIFKIFELFILLFSILLFIGLIIFRNSDNQQLTTNNNQNI